MKYIKIYLVIFLSSSNIFAQNGSGEIVGSVIDAVTKQPLIGANVIILGTNFGAATDINGKYSIKNVPAEMYQLRASVIGYINRVKTDVMVQPGKQTQVDFELSPQAIEIENVVVTADYFGKNILEPTSVRNFSYEELRRSPGGFEDVIRALSVLPGVAQADAGRNDLIVRGGAPSENLYLVDGIEVPNINHFGTQGATGGPLSYINLDFVKETSFSTGGFPVLYGDKLSSVLKINLRNGRTDRIGGKATISASQFGLNAEGPLFNDKSSFIFSARRSYLDFIFKSAGFSFVPEYYDVLTKADYKLDNINSFSFLFVSAFDNVNFFNDDEDKRYDNSRILGSDQIQYFTGFSYQRLFSNGFMNLSIGRNYTDYDTQQSDSLLNPIFKNKSKEEENNLRLDVVHKFSSVTEMNFGATARLIEFDADILFPTFVTSFGDSLPITLLNKSENFFKGASYLNFNFLLMSRITTNLGARVDYFNAIKNKLYFSPRFSVSYMLTPITNLNFSTGIYYQAPSYIWLIADEKNRELKNVKVNQYVLGFDHKLNEDALLKVEGFYKDYSNYPTSLVRPYLVLANTGAGFSGSDDNFSSFGLEPLVSSGYGKSRGVELSVQKKLSNTPYYGILSLTYSKTDFTSLDGIERDGTYDQNWIFNISGGYKIDKYWEVSTKFRFASGRPYTPFQFDGSQLVYDYNSRRLKSAHSLDIRVDKRWFFSGWTLITYVDIQNIYNRKNPGGIRWDRREQRVDETSAIGILPSIGISAEF
ncbi:TonB-dependent receptor plug [Ignavibacterium album JCM 16511]|uniref:TonB-dependent receptor plug n=1 Tax=Ignavibacterium album (strain DSM 19864 / JCM 16511 / NBRC 101810 / Mat9-16) TaxID=945713 RepID=I0AGD7_IGNAJ|nr:TonB-dependent receptor [Ignavibacterium album]AFH48044.1 TonB-dependent receptor plug [Ignavibacterium album JCM 16511]